MSKRYHLMHQRRGNVYYICDTNVHGYAESGDGKVHILNTDDVCKADTLQGLLRKLQERGDGKWFATMDWIAEDGSHRHDEYRYHNEKHNLCAWVSGVCDIRFRKPIVKSRGRYQFEYLSELWYQCDGYTLQKVVNFTELMEKEVADYIADYIKKIHEMVPSGILR